MTIIARNASTVKSARPVRPFAEGVLEPLPVRTPRPARFVPTDADRRWANETSPTRDEFYDVLIGRPKPIAGGAPDDEPTDAEWDRRAGLALAADRLERGVI